MYKSVLVPLDGSELAETVFRYAADIAGRLGLEVTLLHVADPDEPDLLPTFRAYIDHVAEIVSLQTAKVQEKAGIKGKRVQVRGEIIAGYPADIIMRYAEEKKISLILIGSHGRTGIRQQILGSVAYKVLRTSRVPVWLVRAQTGKAIVHEQSVLHKILVPLDGSRLAELVLPHVETLAKQSGSGVLRVTLLQVWEPPVIPSVSTPESQMNWAKVIEEHINKAREAAEKHLADVAKKLTVAGLKVNSELVVGSPADEIIDYAERNHFSLIAMASHGHSGIGRWAYGNVADKVLHGATVSVLLVRQM